MLFALKNVNDGTMFYLLNQEQFILGRKDCDLLIQNDQSISRKHASIRLKNNRISVTDLGSKYKTVYKDKELDPNVEVFVQINDEIHFGVMTSLYKLEQYINVTTSTRLTDSHKVKLNKDLAAIGGKYTDSWTNECTHLTSKDMNVTVKVLNALLDQKLIVTPSFWTKFAENVSQNLPPPNEKDFSDLEISEPLLKDANLSVNPARNTLFIGKVFIFLKEKNKKQMEDIIHKAGGASKLWENNPMPINDVINSPKEFLIVQVPFQEENDSFKKLIKAFSKIGQRTIAISEIATAIIMCNTERFCNSKYKLVEEVFTTKPTRLPTQNPLAANTQSEYFHISCKTEEKSQRVIPDTLENPLEASVKTEDQSKKSNKEKASDNVNISSIGTINKEEHLSKRNNEDEAVGNPFKKLKREQQDKISQQGQQKKGDDYFCKNVSEKRKAEETSSEKRRADDTAESEDSPSPSKKNPFASIKKKIKIEATTSKQVNPFTSIKRQTDTNSPISEDNSFKIFKTPRNTETKKTSPPDTYTTRNRNIMSSTRNDLNENNISRSTIEKCWEMDNTWYSKNTHDNSKVIKMEELESDIQDYIDMFRDKVVVDVLKVVIRDVNRTHDITDGSLGATNFKKFRKVKPLKCQTTIIPKSSFIEMIPGSTAGIVDERKEEYNSDEEIKTNLKMCKKSTKKFVL